MLKNIRRSLEDLLGCAYARAVKDTATTILGLDGVAADSLLKDPIDFFPDDFRKRCDDLAAKVGQQIIPSLTADVPGAPTDSFRKASNTASAPIGGLGCVRIGQDGRVYIAAKSEHYHTPLGHNFPGFRLITNARQLGILNATHNNTRGYITRCMERQVIADINGLNGHSAALDQKLASKAPKVLNRIVNLETGSLAVEAGIKMMLTRFYRLEKNFNTPKYERKIPVFLVIADNSGGLEANYHGTTIFAQTLRGLWPELREQLPYRIVSVRRNDIKDFEDKICRYNTGGYKTAGFLHEIILMNYGGVLLTKKYLLDAYNLCIRFDTPTLSDEIQSCMWYKGMLLIREYGLTPDFVVIGKGFPGGEYPASKIITTGEMDSLNQFGALVTNGQEELASLAYLITMESARENGDEIAEMGQIVENKLQQLRRDFPRKVVAIEGKGHMSAIHFADLDLAEDFIKRVNSVCIDVSAQLYKSNCAPAALLKLPLITSESVLDILIHQFAQALRDVY